MFSEPGAGSDVAGLSTRADCATATSGSSTARRCGPRCGAHVALRDRDRPAPTPTAEAQGHDDVRSRHPGARRRGYAVGAGDPKRRVQRGVLHDVERARRERLGEIGEGWRVVDDPHERTCFDRRSVHPQGCRADRARPATVYEEQHAQTANGPAQDQFPHLWI